MSTTTPQGSWHACIAAGKPCQAFVPNPLPPPLEGLASLWPNLEQSATTLGRLDGICKILPHQSLFLLFYTLKEALLSSQIEGTRSSFSELLLYQQESPKGAGTASDDLRETSNYTTALHHGLESMRDPKKPPLSLRLIKEMHGILLQSGRGAKQDPGNFRRSQNWVGGQEVADAQFIPPPPDQVLACMSTLEAFIHASNPQLPTLIKAALIHAQFETIHPFLDGNGRLGRLLIPLILCAGGVLQEPILYLSLYFKTNRQAYYQWLQAVRFKGDWLGYLRFFLKGVHDVANQGVHTCERILALFEADQGVIKHANLPASVAIAHQALQRDPILTIANLEKQTQLSFSTADSALKRLIKLGIVNEATGKQRGQVFAYHQLLGILKEGAEPFEE